MDRDRQWIEPIADTQHQIIGLMKFPEVISYMEIRIEQRSEELLDLYHKV